MNILFVLLLVGIAVTPFVSGILASNGRLVRAVIVATPLFLLTLYFAFFASFEREAAWGIFLAAPIWFLAAMTVLALLIGYLRYRSKLSSGQLGITE